MSCSVEQLPAGSSAKGGTGASWNHIKVSKELASAVQDDARRKAVDSAKKRAVSQHVDYETFQAMVSVAHLKPIERDEWFRKPAECSSSPAWNFSAEGSLSANALTLNPPVGGYANEDHLSCSGNGPKNAEEFQKRWRSLNGSSEHRLRFLRTIPPEKLLPLFKVEIRPALLGEIFSVLNECWERNDTRSTSESASSEGGTKALEGTMGSLRIEGPSALSRGDVKWNGEVSKSDDETDRDSSGAASKGPELTCGSLLLNDSSGNTECGGTLREDVGADATNKTNRASEVILIQERTHSGSPVDAAESEPHSGSVASGGSQKTGLNENEETADPHTGKRVEEILNILTALSKSGRFGLTLRLLSSGHKKDLRSFFEKLSIAASKGGVADALERLNIVEALFKA
eukprot:TRINITY_DN1865_c0_g1_i1.p1 TRINITY_DN1865_c0_g1~~TRINITY_DN1865_c0_g1_i1.p1  ORF type:complete len:402 (+),score=47.99 TRINITY_DN1865_c0_g1_i1:249-1454(+)